MKPYYVRPDMATLPKNMDPSEKVTIHAVVEEQFLNPWIAEIGETPWAILVEEVDQYHFDAGGIVSSGGKEPCLELDLGDWKLSVFVRHATTLQSFCPNIQNHLPRLGSHVWIPGYWTKAVLSVETGERIGNWIEGLDVEEQSAELWKEHYADMKRAKVHVPPRVG